MLVGFLMVAAIAAGIFAGQAEEEGASKTRMQWVRTIAYWTTTMAVAFEMVAGGIWDLERIEFVRVSLERLGYPLYLLSILWPPKILCAITLLAPRFARLKEWAYAGAVINYMGAAASLMLAGRPAGEWLAPLAFALLTVASWALRPESRRMVAREVSGSVRPIAWCIPVMVFGAMVLVAFATLPSGPPPQ